MIYDFPETSSPIGQGDIFFGVPILDLTDEELPTVDDEGNAQALPWETFASTGKDVSTIVTVRPTIAIVGTQECDALRAPNITLFEVRPFRDVERKSKDTKKPSSWVPILTQHARINQKWFYLPADERIGFSEKMGADFLTPIRIPRLTLERLLDFRKGRLNEVAKQHFRERLSEFFRRYAYDEWYPLTREELAEYQKAHPNATPFPWQQEVTATSAVTLPVNQTPVLSELNQKGGAEGLLDYVRDGEAAMDELHAILGNFKEEIVLLNKRLDKNSIEAEKMIKSGRADAASRLNTLSMRAAGDIHAFSEKLEGFNRKLVNVISDLTKNVLAYIESASAEPATDLVELADFKKQFEILSQEVTRTGEFYRSVRDSAGNIDKQNTPVALKRASHRQVVAYHNLVLNVEELESFCLKTLFLIGERFGGRLPSEGVE